MKIIKFSCHYHYVILLDVATVHCDILCNRMIYYMLCINRQPSSNVIDVYINAQMIILMINAIFLGLLSIDIFDISHYAYGYYFSPQRVWS